MKKRMLSLPLFAWFLLALCACGGGSAPTFDLHTETAYTHIDGLYVDTDYQDPEGQDRHMLYLFYTVYTPDQPLSVRSDATQLTVDECLGRVAKAIENVGGVLLVTADHGNAEKMVDEKTGAPYTAHTVGKVMDVLVNAPQEVKGLRDGKLADIAPTLLDLLGIDKPAEMNGQSLLIK